jgi:hypothetical protein
MHVCHQVFLCVVVVNEAIFDSLFFLKRDKFPAIIIMKRLLLSLITSC